jgi:hypothetical protein
MLLFIGSVDVAMICPSGYVEIMTLVEIVVTSASVHFRSIGLTDGIRARSLIGRKNEGNELDYYVRISSRMCKSDTSGRGRLRRRVLTMLTVF